MALRAVRAAVAPFGAAVAACDGGEWTAESWERHAPPTLRQWLRAKPFGLGVSQGFGCEVASLGATLGLCDGLGGEAALRRQVVAASGASSGAKVSAVVATPSASLEEMAAGLRGLRFRDVLCDFGDTALASGGWVHATKMRRFLEHFVGAGSRVEDLAVPWGTTAFDLRTMAVVRVHAGDVVDACFGSGAFPPLFPPVEFCGALLTDAAFFTDAAGLRAMPGRPGRVLQIANADWPMNGPWVVKGPSDLAHLGRPEVVSLVLSGVARVVPLPPGAAARVPAALDGARQGVRDALDAPLAKGKEPGHYVAVAAAPPQPQDAAIARANAAARVAVAAGAVLVVLARRRT